MNDDRLSPREHSEMRDILLAGTQRIRPAGGRRTQMIAASIALVLVAGVTGGAIATATIFGSDAIAPVSTPTPPDPSDSGPTPSPAPTEDAGFLPQSRYGLDCDTLVDDALIAAAVPSAADADPLVTATGVGIAIPRMTSILSVGGDVCEWSNGAPQNDQYGSNPEYSGIVVEVLPRPDAGWSARAASFGMPDNTRECNQFVCSMSAVVGDAWVTLVGSGAIDPVGTDALFSAVVASVERAGNPAPMVTPTRDRPPLGECEAVLSTASVQTITGISDARLEDNAGGWSAQSEATLAADNFGCLWFFGEMEIATSVSWIHDGRWAYERAKAAGTFAPVTISGLEAGDVATVRCDADFGSACAVDMLRGPDWINVMGRDQSTAIALAEAVVAGRD